MALQSPLTVQPYDYIGDSNGRPLDKGQIYIGIAGQDPEFYQIPVYLDAAMTKLVDQPIRTNDGFVDFAGSLRELYASADVYSLKVLDKQGRTVFFKPEMMRNNLTPDILTVLDNAIIEAQQQAIITTTEVVGTAIDNAFIDGNLTDAAIVALPTNIGMVTMNQQEINAESVTLARYGGKGDGVTNDTTAFTLLETNVTGREIDLQGKSYAVSTLPTSNNYFNGNFVINSNNIQAKGDFKRYKDTSATPFNLNVSGEQIGLRSIMIRQGTGRNNVVQSIAVDEVNRYMYSLSASTPPLICRYDYDKAIYNTAIDYNENADGTILGHQGLAVEQLGGGNTLIWTSSDKNDFTGSRAHTFNYVPSTTGALVRAEQWTLFPEDGVKQSITPNISVDQKWLMVMRQVAGSNGLWVRVFDMQKVKQARLEGRFDIQNEYVSEFTWVDADADPLVARQDIACDGQNIYVLWSTYLIDLPDFIIQFDMSGNFIQKYDSHHIGLSDSEAVGTERLHEPEGLCFVNSVKGGVSLLYQVAHGDAGGRKCYVYELGGEQSASSFTKNTPAFFGQSIDGLTQAVPAGEVMSVGTYSGASGARVHYRYDSTGRFLKGVTRSVTIDGITTGFQWHSTDTQANAVFGRWGSGSTNYAQVMLFKSASSTIGGTAANPSGTTLGAFSFYSDVGTGTTTNVGKEVASIKAVTTGAVVSGTSPTRLEFYTTSTSGNYTIRWVLDSNGDWLPTLNNGYSFGSASNVVKNIYLQNSPIVSSDERLKQNFRSLKAAEKKAALEIKESIYLYKMRDSVEEKGDGARWHVGVKAQQIVSIMESYGLQPFEYGFICYDEWGAQESEFDEDGNEVQAACEAGDKYAVRYDELAMFVLAAT